MPNVSFREGVRVGFTVQGKGDSAAGPTAGMPVGPRGFPPPPPPPPPPPVPLAVVSVQEDSFLGVTTVRVTFDAPPRVEDIPNWTLTGGDPIQFAGIQQGLPNVVTVLIDGLAGTALVVPADATGVTSLTGGVVTAGTYPLT